MKIEKCSKESFVVIGKEGSTNDGAVQAFYCPEIGKEYLFFPFRKL